MSRVGNEQQLNSQPLAAHIPDDIFGELVPGIEAEKLIGCELAPGELPDCFDGQIQSFLVEARGHGRIPLITICG